MPRTERPIAPETGRTRRLVGLFILGFFVLAVGSVPLVQLVWELSAGERLQEFDIFRKVPKLANIERYEDALSDSSILARTVRPGTQWAQLLVAGQGNDKVVIGLDGWLFFRTGIFYATGPGFRTTYALDDVAAKHPDPLPAIIEFHRDLRARGVELVVVPVPVKPQIYPEKLTRSYDTSAGPPANVYQRRFFEELTRRGITVIDLARVLWDAKADGRPLFMPMDTHWTPLGMSVFAGALAEELKRRFPWLAEPERTYKTRPLEVTNKGDIHDMLKLPSRSGMYAPRSITVEKVLDAGTGEPVERDAASPVVLLGDSFMNVFSLGEMKWGECAGLGEHLALHLGRTLDVIAVNGGAPTATRKTLARRGSLSGKKLVVWEFATRELIDPSSEWEIVPLPEVSARVAEGPIEVKAEVILVSEPPTPGEDPYKHCVTFTKYRVLSVEKGEYFEDELIAVRWVMRDLKLLPSADFRVGDVHHLALVPYKDDLHPDLKQAKQADDTEDYVHRPYWVVEME